MNIGDTIGTRTTIDRAHKHNRWYCLMKCACGHTHWAREYDITRGKGHICNKCAARIGAKHRNARA